MELVQVLTDRFFSQFEVVKISLYSSTPEFTRHLKNLCAFQILVRMFAITSLYFSQVIFRQKESNYVEAHGVEYIRHGKKSQAFASKEVIICAGAVMSPHILMHSGIGPENHLKQNGVSISNALLSTLVKCIV